MNAEYNKYNPEHRQIYRFIRTLFNAAQLTAECAIITLVYLERLLKYAEVDISPGSWKRITLGATCETASARTAKNRRTR